jgi:hypothetical protein
MRGVLNAQDTVSSAQENIMDLITELENDIALAVMFERDREGGERDIRDLIANIHTALRPLAEEPRAAATSKKDMERERSQ